MDVVEHSKSPYFKKVGPNLYRTAAGRYYGLVKRGGKQFRRSLKTSDHALAKRRLREFQEKASRLSGDSEYRAMRFEELAERWLASRKPELKESSYVRRVTTVNGLMPFFEGHLVRSTGNREIEEWRTKRGSKLAPRSWNKEAETLRQIFDYAKDHLRIVLENPCDGIKRRKAGKTEIVIPTRSNFANC